MTANDIADMVEKEPYHTNLNRTTIANFIRQQADEIEALKAQLDLRTRELIGASFYEHDYKTLLPEYEALKEQLEECTCQGGHSEAYLKAKGRK